MYQQIKCFSTTSANCIPLFIEDTTPETNNKITIARMRYGVDLSTDTMFNISTIMIPLINPPSTRSDKYLSSFASEERVD